MAFTDTLGLLFEINADPTHAVAALQLLEEEVGAKLSSALGMSQKQMEQFAAAGKAALVDVAELSAGLGAVGGALFAAAEHAAKFAEEVGHVHEKTGATTEQISTLNFAAHQAGISSEVAGRSLGFLAKNLGEMAEGGGKKAANALWDLGVNALDAHGHVRSVADLLPELIERMAGMGDKTRLAADATALFGRGGRELMPLLGQFKDGFKSVEDQARSLGQVLSEEDVRAGEQFLATQRELTAQLNALALTVGRAVIPVFRELVALLSEKLGESAGHNMLQSVRDLAAGLFDTAANVATLGGGFGLFENSITRATLAIAGGRAETQKMTDATVKLDGITRGAAKTAADAAGQVDKLGAGHERAAKAVKEHAKAAEHLRDVLPPVIAEMERVEKSKADEAIKKQALALLDYGKAFQPLASGPLALPAFNANLATSISLWQQLPPYVQRVTQSTTQLSAARRALMDVTKELQQIESAYAKALGVSNDQAEDATKAMASNLSIFIGAIAGRKLQAETEGAFMCAEGAFDVASSIWPPNPQRAIKGLGEIGAGIQMLAVAGKSGHGASVSGGGGADGERSGSDRGESGGAGVGAGSQGVAGNRLAPGAQQSTGGRLNVVVIGEAEQARFFADRVNAADAAGHFMTVSAARRSAPAQG